MPQKRQSLPVWFLAQVAGFVTWAAVGVPMLLERPQGFIDAAFVLWLVCYLGFGVVFWLINQTWLDPVVHRYSLLPLTLMTLATFGVIGLVPGYWIGGILLIIVTSYAPHVLPFRAATLWMLVQTLVMGVLFLLSGEAAAALVQAALYLGFQTFALFTTHAALSEARAREELAGVNAELRATQALLTESSRMTERVRIARDLHDLIGHHLTALSLNLEVASHKAEGGALEHVQKSQALAKLLLSDVRETVGVMRESAALELSHALRALVRDLPGLKVHLKLPPDLALDDPHRAQVVVRCVQEIITNTLKHAGAQNLWLELAHIGDGVEIRAWDDGRGAKEVTAGHGLKGMKERLVALGGDLALASAPGEGFSLRARLPA